MNAALTLEDAAALVEALGDVNVSTVMVTVSNPNELAQHHVAIAPQQNFDVVETVGVLRQRGYGLHFIEVSGEDEPKGFVITAPSPQVEDAEVVADGTFDSLMDDGSWLCRHCRQRNAFWAPECGRCGSEHSPPPR